ncbi:MAG: tetratricopeptide repeat protein [Alphaproteobacteria bacterium]|nr:tetratricopeptide repeat protein [Alphaproteobacteria bacterium]
MAKSDQNIHKIFSSRLEQAKRHHRAGRLREAESLFSKLLGEFGALPEAVAELAAAAAEMGETEAAVSLYRRALRIPPQRPQTLSAFGALLARIGQGAEAIALLRQALALSPNSPQLHYNLGKALAGSGNTLQAIASYQQAISLDPKFVWAFTNLGNALADLGRHEEASHAYRQAIRLAPSDAALWSNFLLSRQYAEAETAETLFGASIGFEESVGLPLRKTWKAHANSRDAERILRVAFISADLRRHPVGYFLEGVLAHLDPSKVAVRVYCDHRKDDDLTQRMRAHVPAWTVVDGMDDAALAKRIREDEIDILIDLAGHTASNRLRVFAMKPAPVQVSWMGYVSTTGLKAMDWIVSDRHQIFPDEDRFYVEKVACLPNSWLCFTPPAEAPPPSRSPAIENGFVTFGCFNNPVKLSQRTLRSWAALLADLPTARLLLRAQAFQSSERAEYFRSQMMAAGLDPSRLDVSPGLAHGDLLASYAQVDIALDPMAYSGGVTTLEALWMGVPVVTLPGATFASRHSTSFLDTLGLNELIASSEADYIAKAKGLAADLARLQELRGELRARMSASPLLDCKTFTRNLETLLRDLWKHWCADVSSSR